MIPQISDTERDTTLVRALAASQMLGQVLSLRRCRPGFFPPSSLANMRDALFPGKKNNANRGMLPPGLWTVDDDISNERR